MITIDCGVPIVSINCESVPDATLYVDSYDGKDIILRFSKSLEGDSINLQVNLNDMLVTLANVVNRNSESDAFDSGRCEWILGHKDVYATSCGHNITMGSINAVKAKSGKGCAKCGKPVSMLLAL